MISTAALSDAELMGVVTRAGWTGDDAITAFAVARAESGGRPAAVNDKNSNGSSDYGLFQINSIHTQLLASGNKFDANDNARMAMQVWKEAGNKWTPWSVYNSRSYVMFTPQAKAAAGSTANIVNASSTSSSDESSSLTNITDPAMWLRIGYFVAGAALILALAASSFMKSPLSNLVPVARVAKIATGKV